MDTDDGVINKSLKREQYASCLGSVVLVAGSFFLLFVAAVFLLGLHWGAVWPVLLILAGVAGLLNSAVKGREAGI